MKIMCTPVANRLATQKYHVPLLHPPEHTSVSSSGFIHSVLRLVVCTGDQYRMHSHLKLQEGSEFAQDHPAGMGQRCSVEQQVRGWEKQTLPLGEEMPGDQHTQNWGDDSGSHACLGAGIGCSKLTDMVAWPEVHSYDLKSEGRFKDCQVALANLIDINTEPQKNSIS